jgi:hypothetical protein
MPPTYPIFSKRAQREQKNKRGAYNFAKSTEYHDAEEWFEARKEMRKRFNPPQPIEQCDLDLKLPLYDEFHYDELQTCFPTIQFYDAATLQRIIAIWSKK